MLLGLVLLFGLITFEKLIDCFRFTFVNKGRVISSLVGDRLVIILDYDSPLAWWTLPFDLLLITISEPKICCIGTLRANPKSQILI